MLAAVRSDVHQMRADIGELLRDTWSHKVDEIKKTIVVVEKERKRGSGTAQSDSKLAQQVEREYKSKMDELNHQLDLV